MRELGFDKESITHESIYDQIKSPTFYKKSVSDLVNLDCFVGLPSRNDWSDMK